VNAAIVSACWTHGKVDDLRLSVVDDPELFVVELDQLVVRTKTISRRDAVRRLRFMRVLELKGPVLHLVRSSWVWPQHMA
jgi:hypothetical protein